MEKQNSAETGKFAATLTLVEIGLGSFLHSLKIPLSGQLLSLNQIALLARATFQLKSKKAALEISAIASTLKSLSPAGKKLTPMLAIAAQGLFFYLGLIMGGLNVFGLFIGTALASSWAFIQPILFIYIFFGKTSVAVAEYFLHELEKIIPHVNQILLWTVIGLWLIKCIAAFIISLWVIRMKEEAFESTLARLQIEIMPKKNIRSANWKLALNDLVNPLFIISLGLTFFFFLFSNSSKAVMIWALLRPLALAYIVFYIVRAWPVENLVEWLRQKGMSEFASSLETAIRIIRKRN